MILKIIAYILRKLMISPLEFFNTIAENIALFPEEREKFFLLSFSIFEVLINTFLFSYIEFKTFSIFTLVKVFFCNVIGLVILGFFFLYSNKDRYKIHQVYFAEDVNDSNEALDMEGETMYTCKYSNDRDNELTGESILTELDAEINFNTKTSQNSGTVDEMLNKGNSKLTKEENIDNKDIIDTDAMDGVSVEDSVLKNVANNLGLELSDPALATSDDSCTLFDDIANLEVPNLEFNLSDSESILASKMAEHESSSIEEEIELISKTKTLDSYHNSSFQGRKRAVNRVLSKKQAGQLNKLKNTFCN